MTLYLYVSRIRLHVVFSIAKSERKYTFKALNPSMHICMHVQYIMYILIIKPTIHVIATLYSQYTSTIIRDIFVGKKILSHGKRRNFLSEYYKLYIACTLCMERISNERKFLHADVKYNVFVDDNYRIAGNFRIIGHFGYKIIFHTFKFRMTNLYACAYAYSLANTPLLRTR